MFLFASSIHTVDELKLGQIFIGLRCQLGCLYFGLACYPWEFPHAPELCLPSKVWKQARTLDSGRTHIFLRGGEILARFLWNWKCVDKVFSMRTSRSFIILQTTMTKMPTKKDFRCTLMNKSGSNEKGKRETFLTPPIFPWPWTLRVWVWNVVEIGEYHIYAHAAVSRALCREIQSLDSFSLASISPPQMPPFCSHSPNLKKFQQASELLANAQTTLKWTLLVIHGRKSIVLTDSLMQAVPYLSRY